jgi:HTH-type transcriptional regulator/antitoxin HigA
LDEWNQEAKLESEQGEEANCWSRKFLIPPEFESELPLPKSREAVVTFAKRVGIHPGIAVGRLQYDRLMDFCTPLNNLKVSLDQS